MQSPSDDNQSPEVFRDQKLFAFGPHYRRPLASPAPFNPPYRPSTLDQPLDAPQPCRGKYRKGHENVEHDVEIWISLRGREEPGEEVREVDESDESMDDLSRGDQRVVRT